MTITKAGVVHRSCTRIDLINALRDIEPGGMTKLRSLGSLADLIMARLPEAPEPQP